MSVIKFILQIIGLATVIWFGCMAYEEYVKIRAEEKEKEKNGQSQ